MPEQNDQLHNDPIKQMNPFTERLWVRLQRPFSLFDFLERLGFTDIIVPTQRDSKCAQPTQCIHQKTSLTSAYPVLGRSLSCAIFCLLQSAQLSELMLNPLSSSPCRVIFTSCSQHALSMWILRSLCFAFICNRFLCFDQSETAASSSSGLTDQSGSPTPENQSPQPGTSSDSQQELRK